MPSNMLHGHRYVMILCLLFTHNVERNLRQTGVTMDRCLKTLTFCILAKIHTPCTLPWYFQSYTKHVLCIHVVISKYHQHHTVIRSQLQMNDLWLNLPPNLKIPNPKSLSKWQWKKNTTSKPKLLGRFRPWTHPVFGLKFVGLNRWCFSQHGESPEFCPCFALDFGDF